MTNNLPHQEVQVKSAWDIIRDYANVLSLGAGEAQATFALGRSLIRNTGEPPRHGAPRGPRRRAQPASCCYRVREPFLSKEASSFILQGNYVNNI